VHEAQLYLTERGKLLAVVCSKTVSDTSSIDVYIGAPM